MVSTNIEAHRWPVPGLSVLTPELHRTTQRPAQPEHRTRARDLLSLRSLLSSEATLASVTARE
jgi:hypothetical protein